MALTLETDVGTVDPVTFEILSHRLHQITREMGSTLERVGGTVNTTQMKDYMSALYRANGDILSAGETTGQHVACDGRSPAAPPNRRARIPAGPIPIRTIGPSAASIPSGPCTWPRSWARPTSRPSRGASSRPSKPGPTAPGSFTTS